MSPIAVHKVTVRIVLVTPAMAHAWLKTNIGNRAVRPAHVAALAAAIDKGHWVLNGETIILSDKGNLLDGQHRLEAIVSAGIPVEAVVVEGVDEVAALTIDAGISRSNADRIVFYTHVERPQLIAAACAVIASAMGARTKASAFDVQDIYLAHIEGFGWAEERLHARRFVLAPVYAAFAVAYPKHKRAVEELAEKLRTGEGLGRGEPALTLSKHLQSEGAATTAASRVETFLKTLRAIQAHIAGEKISKLCLAGDVLSYFGVQS